MDGRSAKSWSSCGIADCPENHQEPDQFRGFIKQHYVRLLDLSNKNWDIRNAPMHKQHKEMIHHIIYRAIRLIGGNYLETFIVTYFEAIMHCHRQIFSRGTRLSARRTASNI
jgi:hypothetical protein